MRIVTAKEFLAIKEPVFYQKYYDIYDWGELSLKYKNCGENDFFYVNFMGQDIFTKENLPQNSCELADLIKQTATTKEHFERDYETGERDGEFDMEQRYVIYDREDIKHLIKEFQKVIGELHEKEMLTENKNISNNFLKK